MERFRIFRTEEFKERYAKLDRSEQRRIDKIIEGLFYGGDVTGKPLGYPFFREKKFKNKRLLYIVYKEYIAILLIYITDKKLQQQTIDEAILRLDEFKKEILFQLGSI